MKNIPFILMRLRVQRTQMYGSSAIIRPENALKDDFTNAEMNDDNLTDEMYAVLRQAFGGRQERHQAMIKHMV